MTHQLVFLLLLALVGVMVNCAKIEGFEGRIINGLRSPEGRWRFMVSLNFDGPQHFCGGTIINDDTILTATHCAFATDQRMSPSMLSVYVGHVNRTNRNPAYVFQASSFILNQQFASTIDRRTTPPSFAFNKGHDVAIVKLARKLPFTALGFVDKIAPVCLASDKAVPIASRCIVMGWGTTSTTDEKASPVLLQANAPIVNWDECSKYHHYDYEQLICSYNLTSHADSCQGDSGGPLVCPHEANPNEYLQFGIVSYGKVCGSGGFYTRVSNWIQWIQERAES